LGFLHGKDDGDEDEDLVDRMGMIGGESGGFAGTGDGRTRLTLPARNSLE
jgi:hypothetical protein